MTCYKFDDCHLDIDRRELRRAGDLVTLEPQVFDLLALLVSNPDRTISKTEINETIWHGRAVSDTALSSRISAARRAIGDDGKSQLLIRTLHGHGFKFVGNVSSQDETRPSTHAKPIVAVVPFDNLSGERADEHIADGISTDVVATLIKHRWLSLISRNSMAKFKNYQGGIEKIVRATGAQYIVEGDVRRAGNRLRVSVRLVQGNDGTCIWSERYDRTTTDLFDVLDNITETIAARIEPEIGYVERRRIAAAAGSRDLQAWQCFHLAIAHFFKFTGLDNVRAQELLQKARTLDPSFGDAHAWWAYAVILGSVYWDTSPEPDILDEALAATQRALQCDDKNAVFYALKARVQLARGEYDSAIEGNRIAINLNPSFAAAHCGLADSLTFLGRYDEAITRFEQAIALSTNDPQRWAFFTYGALALIFAGEHERAIRWASRAEEIPNRQYWSLAHKAVALALSDRDEEAGRAYLAAQAEQPLLSAEFAREKLYFVKEPAQLEKYIDGLSRAKKAAATR